MLEVRASCHKYMRADYPVGTVGTVPRAYENIFDRNLLFACEYMI